MNEAGTILIVDDEPLNIDLLEQELGEAGYRTVSAASGEQALALAVESNPDLILLDARMSGMDGYETCRRLKESEATRALPIIFVTALADTFDKVRAFHAGAVDYVTKPFETEELLARVATHIALRREIESHRRSKATIRVLLEELGSGADAMVGESPAVQRVREQIAQVAPTDSTVLIQGETGSGKELVARAIHAGGRRGDRPLIKLNCAALPRDLVESELFGHEKGAFTGATQQRKGRFELADGGTLFLDEVGELPLEAQAKLLRVLQDGEFERIGGARSLRVDVRLIAATNRDLRADVEADRFRPDLYYRLNVFPITLPPLRARREDIPLLVQHFVAKASRKLGRTLDGIAPSFIARAQACDWPGNVRELENLVERALIVSDGRTLQAQDLHVQPAGGTAAPPPARGTPASLEEIERAHIQRVLQETRWRIEGDHGAARVLGLKPSTLRARLKKLGIAKPA